MSLAHVYSRAQVAMDAPLVTIEVHITSGLPKFSIVGLPEASVKESKDRVRSAIINSHFNFPQERITVNLAPADLPKEGGRFDLAIAVGVLIASNQLGKLSVENCEFYGELSLSGEVRSVNGLLASLIENQHQTKTLYLSVANQVEAQLVKNTSIKLASSLSHVCQDLVGQQSIEFVEHQPQVSSTQAATLDMSDVKGQAQAKRALEIAASGMHNLMFLGPPGTGKSMLAARMSSIMPLMSDQQALETATLYSIMGKPIDHTNWHVRPFRSPHHTCSAVALVGGSSNPKPGEISLAHNGVLFLDELTEFERKVLDSLREPLETRKVTISRAARQSDFPANFQLICALNPSPTGCHKDKRATPEQVLKYLNRISGPFLDRIDLQVELPRLNTNELQSTAKTASSEEIRARVVAAQTIQLRRQGKLNAHLSNKELEMYAQLDQACLDFIARVTEKLMLSPRSYHRTIKVARTIADLSGQPNIQLPHLKEASSYRAFERLISTLTEF